MKDINRFHRDALIELYVGRTVERSGLPASIAEFESGVFDVADQVMIQLGLPADTDRENPTTTKVEQTILELIQAEFNRRRGPETALHYNLF